MGARRISGSNGRAGRSGSTRSNLSSSSSCWSERCAHTHAPTPTPCPLPLFSLTPDPAQATDGNRQELARLLLVGTDVNAVDVYGRTAAMQTAGRGNTECLEVVLRSSPNLELRNMHGMTAFLLACKYGSMDLSRGSAGCVGSLLHAGCDIYARADDGQSAWQLAGAGIPEGSTREAVRAELLRLLEFGPARWEQIQTRIRAKVSQYSGRPPSPPPRPSEHCMEHCMEHYHGALPWSIAIEHCNGALPCKVGCQLHCIR